MNILTENYKLYNGDCLEVMDYLIKEGIKVDCILTDPPYGTTQCKWDSIIPLEEMWEKLNKIIKPNGAILLFGGEPFSSALRMSNIKDYKYDWFWDKVTGTGHLCVKSRPTKRIENIIFFSKKTTTYHPQMEKINDDAYKKKLAKLPKSTEQANTELLDSKILGKDDRDLNKYMYNYPSNVLVYSKYIKECNTRKRVHPTQKPVDLLEYLIKTYTNENELVLDFTMGSGSTGVACMSTNRKFIGIELDENYFNIAKNRIENIATNK